MWPSQQVEIDLNVPNGWNDKKNAAFQDIIEKYLAELSITDPFICQENNIPGILKKYLFIWVFMQSKGEAKNSIPRLPLENALIGNQRSHS